MRFLLRCVHGRGGVFGFSGFGSVGVWLGFGGGWLGFGKSGLSG